MLSSRTEFLNGVKNELPLLLGVMPYGMIYGALAVKLGLPPALALAMSAIVFAGSSQLIGTPLMAAGMSGVVIVATTFVVNLRHALYSASVAPFIKHLLTDEAYAVTITRFTQPDSSAALNRHWFYFGAGLTLWSSWQISSAIGIFAGQLIPNSWSLDFALALTFIALVVPNLKDRASLAAAVSAGIMAVFSYAWPYKLGLFAAAITGIAVGLLIEQRKNGSTVPDSPISE
jgi:4-azaleucine resistance transporter AzlC